MKQPLFVYGNWSAYDELSDGIELTETLAMTQFEHLLRLRAQGVRFDAYLMDAFWYAPEGGYREWRKPHWPEGPDRWLAACGENGLMPGLWFSANTLSKLTPGPRWIDSVDQKGWGMCLFSGGFLQDFASVLEHWYTRGVRVFKFDFAEFNAVPAASGPVTEARERNMTAFREMLAEFRGRCPEAVTMAFNGFEECECMERTDRPLSRFVDPAWLDVFDSMYCGDPRPSDVPDVDFWRSVDLYSDHMTRAFEQSGIPLDRIDNCGFMAGPTGTCYWRGKEGWQRMLLLSLARGGRIHVAYGDLSQFSDEDAKWWAAAQALYAPGMVAGGTRSVGGLPGNAEPFGWMTGNVLTAVNPGSTDGLLGLPTGDWSILCCEQESGAVIEGQDLRLRPGHLTVVGRDRLRFEIDESEAGYSSAVVEPAASKQTIHGYSFQFPAVNAARASLVVWQTDDSGKLVRNWPGELDWLIRAKFRDDETLSFPPRRVWSGMSWAGFEVPPSELSRGFSVEVWSVDPGVVLQSHLRFVR